MNATTDSPGIPNLLSTTPPASTPAQTPEADGAAPANPGQLSKFSAVMEAEVSRIGTSKGVLSALQGGADAMPGALPEQLLATAATDGKTMPVTAEFAAESDLELDDTEAGLLFSMLGLAIDPEAAPAGTPEQGGGGERPLSFSMVIDRAVQGRTPTTPDPQAGPGRTGLPPEPASLAASADPGDPDARLQPLLAGVRDGVTRDALIPQALSPATTAGPANRGPETAPPLPTDVTSPLSSLQPAVTAHRSMPTAVAAAPLEIPVGERGWSKGLGERILWMAGRSAQAASIQINPRHLGPVDIQLHLQQDQAHVTFTSPHAVVRDALEASIPRLREMFNDSNLQLVNVDVGQRGNEGGGALNHPFHERMPAGGGSGGASDPAALAADEGERQGARSGVLSGRGILDDYA